MMAVPIKFRCYQCNQLLGVSRSKIGATVACPRCKTELIVPPSPLNAAELSMLYSGAAGAAGGPDSGLDLVDIRPEDIRAEPGIVIESDEPPIEIAVEELPRTAAPPPAAALPPIPDTPPLTPAPEVAPPQPIEPGPMLVERAPSYRARDVVLTRSTVSLWMLFVLMAQAFAFVAGLLAGHYVWRIH